ncbi:uncharacterized protein (TIGR02611 family) [Nocardia puris]|uniref:Uncharacterized protein (TIGR02611 family) n=1 Tax=Nocardia puris TaxID=208602 RepID=A0A366E1U7_9NOCA|nr:uncharacterized protein (TIGR02611 family) [Nocardia puris]
MELEKDSPETPSGWRGFRARVAARPTLNRAYRIGVGVVGVAVLAVGIVAIPYPGPGWAIVFAGLGILATEFGWAKKALAAVRERYWQLMNWYVSQGLFLRALGAIATVLLVLATLWVLGTFGMVGGWIGVEAEWLRSPLTW